MPFTEEQFNKFIDTLSQFRETQMMLIRIEENTKNANFRLQEHIEVDLKSHVLNENSIEKAHSRIDEIEKQFIALTASIKAGYAVSTAIISAVVIIINILIKVYWH